MYVLKISMDKDGCLGMVPGERLDLNFESPSFTAYPFTIMAMERPLGILFAFEGVYEPQYSSTAMVKLISEHSFEVFLPSKEGSWVMFGFLRDKRGRVFRWQYNPEVQSSWELKGRDKNA